MPNPTTPTTPTQEVARDLAHEAFVATSTVLSLLNKLNAGAPKQRRQIDRQPKAFKAPAKLVAAAFQLLVDAEDMLDDAAEAE